MDIFISDTSFQLVAIIDTYDSFIWTERYSDYGDFELYLSADSSAAQYLKADYYVEIRESGRTMIIEDIQIDTNVEDGPVLKVSGRSLESILDRRIVWKQTSISNKMPGQIIMQLLSENIMESAGEVRGISGFKYASSGAVDSGAVKIPSIQFTGDNLYDVVKSICDVYGFGFKITGPTQEQRARGEVYFSFELFQGANRSYVTDDGYDQLLRPHIVFSPNFDNLLNSSYYESHRNHKTIALVAGQGEGADRVTAEAPGGTKYYLLSEKPSDWSTNYASYYTKADNGYTSVAGSPAEPEFIPSAYYIRTPEILGGVLTGWLYSPVTKRPDDWATSYSSYFIKTGDGDDDYTQVSPITVPVAPDWSSNTYYKRTGDDSDIDTIGKGLSRRELFVDARDLSKESYNQDENGNTSTKTLSDSEYDEALTERGVEKLAECVVVESFEGGIDPSEGYRYGSADDVSLGNADYSIGDIVQVENEYGMSCRCRITEFIRSKDSSGSSAYPTFTKI